MSHPDEFYVGYLPDPPLLHRRLQRLAIGILLLAGPAGAWIASVHTPSAGGTFAYGHPMAVRGEIEALPTPAIRVRDGDRIRRIPLVALGKHGVTGLGPLEGRTVAISVTRIARGHDEMYELAAPPVADPTATPLPAAVVEALGGVTLRGEVVDGKCDLGVMNPGEGGLHRACAVRCLSGGVPPMLLLRDTGGHEARVALAGVDAPLPGDVVRQWGGAAVEVHGTLVRRDGAPLLLVASDGIRRLP